MQRFERMFASVKSSNELAFVPFTVLGYPSPTEDVAIIKTMIDAGADALELGIPFSDPIADGSVIQGACETALEAGASFNKALDSICEIRTYAPELPISLLIYANLLEARGLKTSYTALADAGVDAVLVADVPGEEWEPYAEAAHHASIQPVALLPSDAEPTVVERVAQVSEGYLYVVARKGVTGDDRRAEVNLTNLLNQVRHYQGPPSLMGFGISEPSQVAQARRYGADGVITGSAIVRRIEDSRKQGTALISVLTDYVRTMKAATKNHSMV